MNQIGRYLDELVQRASAVYTCSVEVIRQAILAIDQYETYSLPKRIGGFRTITVVPESLLQLQRYLNRGLQPIYEELLADNQLTDTVHGFVAGRSAYTNAFRHRDGRTFIICDLKGAFDQITEARLLTLFYSIEFDPGIAELTVRLVTHKGVIPQGAPTSPVLLNLCLLEFDQLMMAVAFKHGYTYTRYADDLCFSDDTLWPIDPKVVLQDIQFVARSLGFMLNEKKTRLLHVDKGAVKVTGCTISPDRVLQIALPRRTLKMYRAMLHRATQGLVSHEVVMGTMGWVKIVYNGQVPQLLLEQLTKYQSLRDQGLL
jgi:RNA-directed DNA polymerase